MASSLPPAGGPPPGATPLPRVEHWHIHLLARAPRGSEPVVAVTLVDGQWQVGVCARQAARAALARSGGAVVLGRGALERRWGVNLFTGLGRRQCGLLAAEANQVLARWGARALALRVDDRPLLP